MEKSSIKKIILGILMMFFASNAHSATLDELYRQHATEYKITNNLKITKYRTTNNVKIIFINNEVNIKIVEKLLKKGANPNSYDGEIIWEVIKIGNFKMADVILSNGGELKDPDYSQTLSIFADHNIKRENILMPVLKYIALHGIKFEHAYTPGSGRKISSVLYAAANTANSGFCKDPKAYSTRVNYMLDHTEKEMLSKLSKFTNDRWIAAQSPFSLVFSGCYNNHGSNKDIQKLIKRLVFLIDIEDIVYDDDGTSFTPLAFVAWYGDLESFKTLLKRGAKITDMVKRVARGKVSDYILLEF